MLVLWEKIACVGAHFSMRGCVNITTATLGSQKHELGNLVLSRVHMALMYLTISPAFVSKYAAHVEG